MLRPLHNKVLVQLLSREKVSKGGIIIPDVAEDKEPSKQGKVIATGPGGFLKNGERCPCPVKAGDVVVWKSFQGDYVVLEEGELARHVPEAQATHVILWDFELDAVLEGAEA